MDEAWTLILLSIAMLIGCYLAGSVPLAVTLSEAKLKLVTVLGAGLLVGTALAVIIPEGVHALLSSGSQSLHDHPETGQKLDVPSEKPLDVHTSEVHEHNSATEAHSWIGVALVLGFVFMLLVDQIGGNHSVVSSEVGSQHRHKITATLGLVVHAAADGIALGAAASTSQVHVEMIVFVAIMLHKAPAAFGLVSFLLHEGFDRNRIRKHLLVFSLSAPLLSIITYFGLSQRSKEVLSEVNATGIAMLFSGGTFLYVATVHILPELGRLGNGGGQNSPTPVLPETNSPGPVHVHKKGFTNLEVAVMVVGCLLPLVLVIGHHH